MSEAKEIFSEWDDYADAFSIITTSFQSEVYSNIAKKLSGNVVDFGSGSAKIVPYVAENTAVESYTGVDASIQMIEIGCKLISRLGELRARMVKSTIEDFKGSGYCSAVSVNSYYVWKNPVSTLKKIHLCLEPGADFFMVTPNASLNMPILLDKAKKEHILNPAYSKFIKSNNKFDKNMCNGFVSLDQIIIQCHQVGFEVVSCHQKYYLGGVNYLHLRA